MRDRRERLRVVQASRDKGKKDADLLVRCLGNFKQFGEDADGLGTVGILHVSFALNASLLSLRLILPKARRYLPE